MRVIVDELLHREVPHHGRLFKAYLGKDVKAHSGGLSPTPWCSK